jgi:phage terminase large subunit-like protein
MTVGQVVFSDGRTLTGTYDHPIMTEGGQWVPLGDLEGGDKAVTVESSSISVISVWRPRGEQYVYNLQVDGVHEYIANGILTHNCDELAAWSRAQDTWDMMQFGLRLGQHPQVLVTTTPKPTKLIRNILADDKTIISRGSTYDNAANLAGTFLEAVRKQYEGTRLGRQELYAEILDEASGALWSRSLLASCEIDKDQVPDLRRIVVSIDPAITSNAESDMTGIVVAGVDINGTAYVLEDATGRYTPQQWAAKAVELYNRYEADRVVAEKNQGGDMVKHTLLTECPTLPIRLVHASRGKMARAEPVSALYEQGKVKHVKGLNELEDQMVTWEPLGSLGSPDRLDSLVWSITDLLLNGYAKPAMQLAYAPAVGLARS